MLPFPTSERLAQYLVLFASVGFTASIHPLLQTGTLHGSACRHDHLDAATGHIASTSAPTMFVVIEAEAAAIRPSSSNTASCRLAIEQLRRFPGIIDNAQARECVAHDRRLAAGAASAAARDSFEDDPNETANVTAC
jgi:hypothetical protein